MNPPIFNTIQEKVISSWHEVLGVDFIEPHNNFFELGGNSIQAMEVTSLLSESFNIELTLPDFFERLTITKLSELIMQRM